MSRNPWTDYRSTLRPLSEDELSAAPECRQEPGCRREARYLYTCFTLDPGGGGSWKTRAVCEFHAREVDRQDVIGFAWPQ